MSPRILIPRALTPAAFAARDPGATITDFAGETMGTRWSLRAVAPPPGIAEGVQATFDAIVAQMSQWEVESDLSRFNHSDAGAWQSLAAEFATVLAASLDVSQASGGAFDPTMGQLIDLWGFGASERRHAPPSEAAIEALLANRGGVEFDPGARRARRFGNAALDFSGIAKGFGVDHAAAWLRGQGVAHFLIEVGGELYGAGVKPDGQPWWVDLELPPDCRLPPSRVALHDLAVATSGDYRRWFAAAGRRYAHSLDPQSGRPLVNGVNSVTVLHKNCMLADAWATALTVAGAERGLVLAEGNGLAVQIIARGRETMSAAWRAMLD